MQINANYLFYFRDLAKTLSFSQTARNLTVAQPAVSRAIKTLEEQLGVQLFIRDNKRVLLTGEGKRFLGEIDIIMEKVEESVRSLQDERTNLSGKLVIGSLYEFGELHVVNLVKKFQDHYPNMQIELKLAGNHELNQMLKAGDIDFMFGISEYTEQYVRAYRLLKQSSFLVTSSSTKKITKNLDEMQFVLYRDHDPLLNVYLKKFYPKISAKQINKYFVVNSHLAMVNLLSSKSGLYAVLPEYSGPVEKALSSGKLQKVTGRSLSTDIYFVYLEKEFHTKKSEALKEFVLKNTGQVNAR